MATPTSPIPQQPQRPQQTPWFTPLLVLGSFFALGGAMLWFDREPPKQEPALPQFTDAELQPLTLAMANRPMIDTDEPMFSVHSMRVLEENGVKIVKIQVRPESDEILIDGETGRFIGASVGRFSAPPAGGKFAAPFKPMM